MLHQIKEIELLTEASVEKSFRKIVKEYENDDTAFDRAEELLEELRPESPLRHRLSLEIDELRSLLFRA